MIDTVVIQPSAETGEPAVAGVSWAAVTAGAVASCALTLVVLAFGVVPVPITTPVTVILVISI